MDYSSRSLPERTEFFLVGVSYTCTVVFFWKLKPLFFFFVIFNFSDREISSRSRGKIIL
jgi:hypothetical protein